MHASANYPTTTRIRVKSRHHTGFFFFSLTTISSSTSSTSGLMDKMKVDEPVPILSSLSPQKPISRSGRLYRFMGALFDCSRRYKKKAGGGHYLTVRRVSPKVEFRMTNVVWAKCAEDSITTRCRSTELRNNPIFFRRNRIIAKWICCWRFHIEPIMNKLNVSKM
mgnify:CR=1 FL=1